MQPNEMEVAGDTGAASASGSLMSMPPQGDRNRGTGSHLSLEYLDRALGVTHSQVTQPAWGQPHHCTTLHVYDHLGTPCTPHTPLNTTTDPSTPQAQPHTPEAAHVCPRSAAHTARLSQHPRVPMHHCTQPHGHCTTPVCMPCIPQNPACCHGSHTTTGTQPGMHSQRQGYNAPCLSFPVVAAGPIVGPLGALCGHTDTLGQLTAPPETPHPNPTATMPTCTHLHSLSHPVCPHTLLLPLPQPMCTHTLSPSLGAKTP